MYHLLPILGASNDPWATLFENPKGWADRPIASPAALSLCIDKTTRLLLGQECSQELFQRFLPRLNRGGNQPGSGEATGRSPDFANCPKFQCRTMFNGRSHLDLLWGIHQSNIGQRYNRYILLRSILNQLVYHKKHGEIYAFLALIDYFQARLTTLAVADTFRDENRLRWNQAFVKTGNQYLRQAFERKHVGPFILRAQIVHEQVCAPTLDDIHWLMIADLYQSSNSMRSVIFWITVVSIGVKPWLAMQKSVVD